MNERTYWVIRCGCDRDEDGARCPYYWRDPHGAHLATQDRRHKFDSAEAARAAVAAAPYEGIVVRVTHRTK